MSEDFRFDYRKVKSRHMTLAQLDRAAEIALDTKPNWFSAILSGIKLLFFSVYIIARYFLVKENFEIEKQEYEQRRHETDKKDFSSDDKD